MLKQSQIHNHHYNDSLYTVTDLEKKIHTLTSSDHNSQPSQFQIQTEKVEILTTESIQNPEGSIHTNIDSHVLYSPVKIKEKNT